MVNRAFWPAAAAIAIGCTSNSAEPSVRHRATSSALTRVLPAMHAKRLYPSSALLPDGRALVAGGENSSSTAESSAEIFDPKTGTWTVVSPMHSPRARGLAVRLADGRVLVAGGDEGDETSTRSDAEIYDVKTDAWIAIAPMRSPRRSAAGSLLLDGKALVIGGGNAAFTEVQSAETYDASTDTWSSVGTMIVARSRFFAVPLPDGRVVVGGDANAAMEVFDATSKTFRAAKGSKVVGSLMAATRLADGRVLASGGDDDGVSHAEAYLFDPATESVSATTTMPVERVGHSLTLLPSGKVLAFGGELTGAMLLFDPLTSAWNDAGFAVIQRFGHAAVAFGDGSVLLAGGSEDGSGFSGNTDRAELFVAAIEGSACKTGGECLSGSCVSGKCAAPVSGTTAPPPATTVSGSFVRCGKNSECSSSHCVDGVCCDSDCTEACHSCALPTSPGICTKEPVGVDLRGECGARETCSGTCGPTGACIGSTAGSLCAPSACTSATTGRGPAVCTAPGASCPTSEAITFDCSPYTCEPAFGACRDNCATSSDCAGGFVCSDRTCIAPGASPDAGGCTTASGRGSSGAWLLLLALAALARSARA